MKYVRWSIDEGIIRWDDEEKDRVDYLYDIIWERWAYDDIDCMWMVLK